MRESDFEQPHYVDQAVYGHAPRGTLEVINEEESEVGTFFGKRALPDEIEISEIKVPTIVS